MKKEGYSSPPLRPYDHAPLPLREYQLAGRLIVRERNLCAMRSDRLRNFDRYVWIEGGTGEVRRIMVQSTGSQFPVVVHKAGSLE